MSRINFGRVVLGGIVAGIILNVGEYVLNEKVLGAQMKIYLADHKFAGPSSGFLPIAVGMTVVLGIVIVLGYAAIRPRFGPGPKSAIIAALFAWFGISLYNMTIISALGIVPANIAMTIVPWELVEYIIAALVGASLYREA